MKKKPISQYFVFGTLHNDTILKALLGYVPKSYEATLQGYGVFRGKGDDIPKTVRDDIATKHDISKFSFLYAHKDSKTDMKIFGKVLEIKEEDEKILDLWERFPAWYGKDTVYVMDKNRMAHEVCVYAINKPGEHMPVFERVQGDLKIYVQAAKNLRAQQNLLK